MEGDFWAVKWVFAISFLTATYLLFASKKSRKLPPGPKLLPLLGNMRDFPPAGTLEYEHWSKHKDLYGPISSVSVMGMTMVLIHDRAMAHELLDQHSSKTSGRPTMVMANELCGYEAIALCQSYTPRFRRYRKMLHREIGTVTSAAQFRGVQELEVGRQLVRTLKEPGQWLAHLKTATAAIVLETAYGYRVEPHGPDVLVETIGQMMTEFSLAAVPMSWAVDILPVLKHLPDWFPGTTFKATARKWRQSIEASAYIPYRFVRSQMDSKTNRPSYVSKLVEQLESETEGGKLSREDEDAIIWTAASLYGAAADTAVITLTAFTLAMIRFPHVQRKAQEELDRVIAGHRLPTFEDRGNLPYVDAIVKEASRWWPIAPMGFPHTVTEAFEYRGYHIPEGALLLPSAHLFLHDPSVYRQPDAFDPERFLAPRNEPNPYTEAFGYGRRICSGRFFADSALFITIAQTLACFSIEHALDQNGNCINIDHVKPKPGVLAYPNPFDFRIEARSEKHAELIRDFEKRHPWTAGDSVKLDAKEVT